MTSEFLKKRLNRIDLFLQKNYIDKGKIPGAQILVAKNGKVEHFSNLGLNFEKALVLLHKKCKI